MAMDSEEDTDVGGSGPIGNRSKGRIWYRSSIGGELAFVETLATIEQSRRWTTKKRLLTEPKAVDR